MSSAPPADLAEAGVTSGDAGGVKDTIGVGVSSGDDGAVAVGGGSVGVPVGGSVEHPATASATIKSKRKIGLFIPDTSVCDYIVPDSGTSRKFSADSQAFSVTQNGTEKGIQKTTLARKSTKHVTVSIPCGIV